MFLRDLLERPADASEIRLGARLTVPMAFVAGALLMGGCGGAGKSADSTQQRRPAAPPARLVAQLKQAAQGMPVTGVTQIKRATSTGLWSLSAATSGKWLCFGLRVPHLKIGNTNCATQSQIAKEELLIYPGAEPPATGNGLAGYVVYGVASAKVKSLALTLSDCATLHISLKKRPLFWKFIPPKRFEHRIIPTRVTVEIDSRSIGGSVPTLGPSPHGSCATSR